MILMEIFYEWALSMVDVRPKNVEDNAMEQLTMRLRLWDSADGVPTIKNA